MKFTLLELKSQMRDVAKEYISEKVRDPRGVLPDIFKPGDPLAGPSARDRSRFPETKYKLSAKEINYVREILEEFYKLGGYPTIKGRKKSSAKRVALARLGQRDRSKFLSAESWLQWALAHNAVVSGEQELTKRILGILKSGKRRKFSWYYFSRTRDGKRRGNFTRTPKGKKHFSPRARPSKPKAEKPKASKPEDYEALRYILNFRPDPSHPKYGDRTGRYRGVNLSPGTREQVKKLQAAANKVIEKRYKRWEASKIEEDGIWGLRSYKYIRKIISDYSSGERRVIRILQNAENRAYVSVADMETSSLKSRLYDNYRMSYLDSRIRPQDMKYLPQPSWANHSNQAYKDLWERFSWATAAKLKKYRKETPMEKTKRDSRGRRIGGLKIPEKFRWMTRTSPHDIPTRQEYQGSKEYCTGRQTRGCLKLFRSKMDSLCKNRPGEMPPGVCDDWELWKKREKTTPKKQKKPSRAQLVAKAPKKPKEQAATVSKAPKKQKGEKAAVYIPKPGMSFTKAYWTARRKGYLRMRPPGKKYSMGTKLRGESTAAWKKKMCSINPDCYVAPTDVRPVAEKPPKAPPKVKTTKAPAKKKATKVAKAAPQTKKAPKVAKAAPQTKKAPKVAKAAPQPPTKKWDSYERDEDW